MIMILNNNNTNSNNHGLESTTLHHINNYNKLR